MDRDVSVIGLGRVGLPLALSFADRGLSVVGVDKDADRLEAVRDGRDAVPGERRPGGHGPRPRVRPARASPTTSPTPRARGTSSSRSARRRSRTSRSTSPTSAPRSMTLLPVLRPGHSLILRSTIAPGTTDFVAGYIEKNAPACDVGDERLRRPRARAHRRRPLLRGDRLAAADHRRRRRALRPRSSASCSTSTTRRSWRPRRCRPSSRRSGRTSCATRRSRSRTS